MSVNQDRVNSIQSVLRVIFGVVPIAAGLDKFLNFLTDWTQYIHPAITGLLPFEATTLMHIVGVVEIAAGIIVLSRFTEVGAFIVAAWLALIALTLIASGQYLDVAVRDLVMSASAYSLAVLSRVRHQQEASAYDQSSPRVSVA